MNTSELIVEWLAGHFISSLETEFEEDYIDKFYEKYPQLSGMNSSDLDRYFIEKVMPSVAITDVVKSRRVYVYFLESLFNGSRYASELFCYRSEDSVYRKVV
jgi:hypothetical protein